MHTNYNRHGQDIGVCCTYNTIWYVWHRFFFFFFRCIQNNILFCYITTQSRPVNNRKNKAFSIEFQMGEYDLLISALLPFYFKLNV